MAQASTSRYQLVYIAEAVQGTIPKTEAPAGTPPQVVRYLRNTGESLDFALGYEASKEIRADRMVGGTFLTKASAAGGVNFEFSYQEFDPFLAAALMSGWGTVGAGGEVTVTASFSDNTLTAASGTPFAQVAVGQWLRISGATPEANNGVFKVSAKTDASLTLLKFNPATQLLDAAFDFTAATDAVGVKVSTSRVKNGVTMRSFALEKRAADIGQNIAFAGMTPSKLSLDISSGGAVTGSVDFMGYSSVAGTVTAMPAEGAPSQTYSVINAIRGVGAVQEGGADLADTFIKKVSLNIDNALREQDAIGHLGAIGIGAGTLKVTGSMTAYFSNGRLYQKYLDSSASSLSLVLLDGALNGYNLLIPKLHFTAAKIVNGAIDQDVMVEISFSSEFDPATNAMIIIDRFGDAVSVS